MIVCKRPVAPDDHLQEADPQKEEREEKKGGGEEIVEGKIAADGTGSNRLQEVLVDLIKIKSFFCNKSGCPLAFYCS